MSEFARNQGIFIFYYILAGFGFAVLFDIFTLSQKIFKNPRWLIILEDTIYWIIFTIVFFLMNYNILDGQIKGYTLLGMFLGFGLYFFITRGIFKKKS